VTTCPTMLYNTPPAIVVTVEKNNMEQAIALIKEFEGFRPTPYQLPGEPYLTIGWGRHEKSIKWTDRTTREAEHKWLVNRTNRDAQLIKQAVTASLNDNELQALVSFVYNVGINAFRNSTLLRKINSGDPTAANEFDRWVKGRYKAGLTRRRKAEKALFNTPVTKPIEKMKQQDLGIIHRAYTHTKGLPHQVAAWEWLLENLDDSTWRKLSQIIDPALLEEFLGLYRNAPESEQTNKINIRLLSQRDNKGDINGDGRADWLQTCNVTSCAMVIEAITGKAVSPTELDKRIYRSGRSRYNHADLVKLMSEYGVKSRFSTSTRLSAIKSHLDKGLAVIWSNRLTHGGHIVVLGGYDDKGFTVYDPYGECFPTNTSRTKWTYKDVRKPYNLSFESFNIVNMNGFNYDRGSSDPRHWCHLCSKA